MPDFIHKELARGPWFRLSFVEQMANIGSEVSRARGSYNKDPKRFRNAFDRGLDLFDLTLEDPRLKGRRFEIARAREFFCAAALGENFYSTSLQDLERYFLQFAAAASLSR